MHDLLIKDVEIYDGTGNEPIKGNIWVEDGKVVGIGGETPEAREIIDADGLARPPPLHETGPHSISILV